LKIKKTRSISIQLKKPCYKKHELRTFREHMGSTAVVWWGTCSSSFYLFFLGFFLFSLSSFSFCVLGKGCQCLWIVNHWLPLWFSSTFIYIKIKLYIAFQK